MLFLIQRQQLFAVIVLCAGLSMGYADEEDPTDEVSDDFIEIKADLGQLPTSVTVLLSKMQFSELIIRRIYPVTKVFNVRASTTTLVGDDIVFSVMIDGSAYHDIYCDVDVHTGGIISFMNCQSDEVMFENKEIEVKFSDVGHTTLQLIYNDGVVFKQQTQ